MYDPVSLYRTAQVVTGNPVERVVLLYEGAVRFAIRHLDALERRDFQAAHTASLRCQEVVAELQEVLDLSAGPIAQQLDGVYRFMLERLVAGNMSRSTRPTVEVLDLLRDLLAAWQEVSRRSRLADFALSSRPAFSGDPGHAAAAAGLAVARSALA